MQSEIPLVRPYIAGNEAQYVAEVIRSGQLASDGRFTRSCAEFLSRRFDIGKALLTPSCTAALEMAALLCDLGPGDEVILPSYTFVSTANAIVLRGASPRCSSTFCPDTLNLDDALIEEKITPRTKAIFPVHYAGVACEMDRIMTIARKHGLLVVEDAAQAVNSKYQDRFLGSIGDLGTYSFHETKNYVRGEGGRAVHQQSAIGSNGPRSSATRERNRGQFLQAARWTNTPGSTWAVLIFRAKLPPHSSTVNSSNSTQFKQSCRRAFEFYQHHLRPPVAEGC